MYLLSAWRCAVVLGTLYTSINVDANPVISLTNEYHYKATKSFCMRIKIKGLFPIGIRKRRVSPSPQYVCVLSRSVVSDSAILWTAACQAPLSMWIPQARILEWVAILFSRGSSPPRDQTQVSRFAGGLFTTEPPGKSDIDVVIYLVVFSLHSLLKSVIQILS